jgi:hypothetical protein
LQDDAIGGDTFFFDKLLDLLDAAVSDQSVECRIEELTRSMYLSAFSLTKGLAIWGIFCEALSWPSALTISFSENSFFCCWDIVT